MPEKSLSSILDRDQARKHAIDHFAEQVALIRDMTDYGSNLMIRAFNSSKRALPDVVVCGVLLKQIVAMLDAISILVEEGMVHAAFLPARAAFEASIYLEWILFSDSDRKAKCYIVSNYRDERRWAMRAIRGTPEENAFEPIAKSVGLDIHARNPTLAADAQKHLEEVNRILDQPGFRAIDQEFNMLRKGKRKLDVEWYELAGAKSIRKIAVAVDRLAEYELFYSKGSQISHSASYKDHIRLVNGKVHFKPIRSLQDINVLINCIGCIAIRTFQNTLRYYRPDELPTFSKKYARDWRTPFLTVKSVKYNFEQSEGNIYGSRT